MAISDNILEIKALVCVLLDKIAFLESTVSRLEAENAALRAENAELKARLNSNSQNSSKPPSSDGLRKKPAFPIGKNGTRGGQQNHKGSTLEMVEKPDHVVICKPSRCICGQDLSGQPISVIGRRQVFDLPEPRLEITEYQIAQLLCPACGQVHRCEFPSEVKAQTQYGTGVRALSTLLNIGYKLPFEKIQTLFHDLFGYSINEGTIIAANTVCYNNLADSQAVIQEKIIGSQTAHADESGIRCQGKLHWLHVTSTSLFTYLFVHPKRGKQAIEGESSILNRFYGWLVHDCWSSYFNLTHLKHALCGAHLLRELHFDRRREPMGQLI